MQFDGSSKEGHAMGGVIILDMGEVEIFQSGQYCGAKKTNNKAKSFDIRDAL